MNIIVERLRQIAKSISAWNLSDLTMRIPAEPDRDADLVVMRSADLIEQQAARISELESLADSRLEQMTADRKVHLNLRAAIEAQEKCEPVFIVFDGPPSHDSGRFVEVETVGGKSISAGEWNKVSGFWNLGPFYTRPQPIPPGWQPTDEELTAIYMTANRIEGKNPPITTERIFTAMRAVLVAAPKKTK